MVSVENERTTTVSVLRFCVDIGEMLLLRFKTVDNMVDRDRDM